jgi:hypothetical protein
MFSGSLIAAGPEAVSGVFAVFLVLRSMLRSSHYFSGCGPIIAALNGRRQHLAGNGP